MTRLSTQPALDELLFSLLIEKRETWRFFKHYSCQILLNKTLERIIIGIPKTESGKMKLKEYKEQVIKHYISMHELVQKQIKFYTEEVGKNIPHAAEAKENVEEHLRNFEFLIHPNRGYILQIMRDLKGTTDQIDYQREILNFLISIFTVKDSIFMKSKSYIDAYLSYAYLAFIKLYHSISNTDANMELIHLYLQLLLGFSMNKNEKIIMKFYQLRLMDFIVREVNLEYEITQTRSRPRPQPPQQQPAQSAQLKSASGPLTNSTINNAVTLSSSAGSHIIQTNTNNAPDHSTTSLTDSQGNKPGVTIVTTDTSKSPLSATTPSKDQLKLDTGAMSNSGSGSHHLKFPFKLPLSPKKGPSSSITFSPSKKSLKNRKDSRPKSLTIDLKTRNKIMHEVKEGSGNLPSSLSQLMSTQDVGMIHSPKNININHMNNHDIESLKTKDYEGQGKKDSDPSPLLQSITSPKGDLPLLHPKKNKHKASLSDDDHPQTSARKSKGKAQKSKRLSMTQSNVIPLKTQSKSLLKGTVIPGLALDSSCTIDGVARQGKDVNLSTDTAKSPSSARSHGGEEERSGDKSDDTSTDSSRASATDSSEYTDTTSTEYTTDSSSTSYESSADSAVESSSKKELIKKLNIAATEKVDLKLEKIIKTSKDPAPSPASSEKPNEKEKKSEKSNTAREESKPEKKKSKKSSKKASGKEESKLPAIPSLKGIPLKGSAIGGGIALANSGAGGIASLKLGGIPKLTLGAELIKGGQPANAAGGQISSRSKEKGIYEAETQGNDKLGILSELENRIDKEDPKWQLVFENNKKGEHQKGNTMNNLTVSDIHEINMIYNEERSKRKLYSNTQIHISILQLIFSLMLTPCGTLDSLYSEQFPTNAKKLNIPFLVRMHISHPANKKIMPLLISETQKMGRDTFRLLKLLATELFMKDFYNDLRRLAIGMSPFPFSSIFLPSFIPSFKICESYLLLFRRFLFITFSLSLCLLFFSFDFFLSSSSFPSKCCSYFPNLPSSLS